MYISYLKRYLKFFMLSGFIFILSSAGFCLNPSAVYIPATYEFTVKHTWLVMTDGVRLSTTIYQPVAKTPGEKFPIVLEALPYRKDDSFASRDYPLYSYLARRGIAGVRVDIRGFGASEGRLPDREYSDVELNDMPEIIAQLAKLPWSNGNIGLQGKSWSAFNGIMTAMRNPPHLKATLFLHGSEDPYANDLHTIDGGLHYDMFVVEMETENMMPGAPFYRIDDAYIRDRFEVKSWVFNYLRHQQDGDFWKKDRSLYANYQSFRVPAYVIGGLLDGYKDFVPHMLANVNAPMRGEMGPWNHAFPNTGEPGPNYEWRQTAVRWWQHWLNGKDTGIMNEAPFTVFMRGYVPPNMSLEKTPGSFWAEDRIIKPQEMGQFILQKNHSLSTSAGQQSIHKLVYQPDSGVAIGNWWGETTGDVKTADEGGLVYDTAPLKEKKCLMGMPKVQLKVAANKPLAHWIVRLEDVAPDGSVSFITGGLINGAHRESRLHPKPLEPNKFFDISIPLHFTTWTFEKNHKIRLVISNAQFPMIWPTPYAMTTQLQVGDQSSKLYLPFVIPPTKYGAPHMPPLEAIEPAPNVNSMNSMDLSPFRIMHDKETGITTATADESSTWKVKDREYHIINTISYSVNIHKPAEASFNGQGFYQVRMGKRVISVQSIINIRSDEKNFYAKVRREIRENYRLIKDKEWEETIPRNFQ